MKKNFTYMLALCAFMIFGFSSAKAGEITYDFRAYAQQYCASAMEELKLTGEVFKVGSTQVTTIGNLDYLSLDGRIAVQSSDFKMRLRTTTDGGMWNVTGTGPRMVVIKNLKAGDKVTLDTNGSTFVSGSVDGLANGDAIVNNTPYEVTADGYFAININRSSCLNIVKIETAAEETVSSPTIAVTGANGINRTVVITPGHSDVEGDCTTLFTRDGSDPIESSTADFSAGDDPIEFVVNETCTVKAITIGVTGAMSEVASLDVTAGDYIELNLALSVAMNDGVATFTATSDNSNIYGAPTATISFAFDGQEAGDGNSFTPTADGALLVTASADGYGDKEIEVPVFAKYKERWASSDYSTPGIGGDFEGWVLSSETGRWANWADVEGGYTYYVLEESTANNITLEGDEDGKEGVRMRGVLAFVDGFGISRNVTGTETIGNIASKGLGRIATFRIYNGYNKSESYYEVGYVNLDGSSWLQHQLQGGHCLVQTIAYMGDEQPAPSVATAIQTVNVEKEDNAVFNLQGQRVSNPAHGIFITKGRKVVF